jgi:hypothetical protein
MSTTEKDVFWLKTASVYGRILLTKCSAFISGNDLLSFINGGKLWNNTLSPRENRKFSVVELSQLYRNF